MKKRILSAVLTFVMIAVAAVVPVTQSSASGTPSSWAYAEVSRAEDAGLVTSSVSENYQANITREQFCEMVVLAYEKISGESAEAGNASFSDTSNAEILKAANLGIVNGIGNNKFAPSNYITRQEIAVMLVRMIDAASPYADISIYNSYSFADKDDIDDWALPSVNFAYENGIMQGVGGNMIAPLNNTTCEEAILLVYRTVEKYDLGNLYYSKPSEDNLAEDDDSGITFIDNELILHMVSDTPLEDVQNLAAKYGGEIVGEITIADTYQIRFDNSYTYPDMQDLIDKLESEDNVSWVSLNMAFETEPDYYPTSDTEWKNDWGDKSPSGLNWGVEAINAPGAWEYKDYMKYIKVGVFDCCFYNHEDLTYTEKYFNHPDQCDPSVPHGTHVSGTIAAGFDNGVGISGVAPYVILYGFSYSSSLLSNYSYTMLHEIAFAQLIVFDKCKVINFSNNTGRVKAAGASDLYQPYINTIKATADEEGKFLQALLNSGYDFTICVAAGNGNNKTYYKYTSKNNPGLKMYSDSIKTYYAYDMTTIKGNYLALYNNYLNAIDIQEVKDRIIVVGSCGNNGNGSYSYSDFSGIGDRVDVMAPGESIYSTITNNSYASWDGTSMATPHVSGVAAMLYSVDSTLGGDDVKRIIKDTAKYVAGCDYNMLDAETAVEETLYAYYSGSVVNADGTPAEYLTVYAKDADGNTLYEGNTGKDGSYFVWCNRMEIDHVDIMDNDTVAATVDVPNEYKEYDYYATNIHDTEYKNKFAPHNLGTTALNDGTYWIIFNEGYRDSRVEMSTVKSSLPSDDLYFVWNRSLELNDTSGSGTCSQYYLEDGEWIYMREYRRLSDWATDVIASNLNVYDKNGNLILEASSDSAYTIYNDSNDYDDEDGAAKLAAEILSLINIERTSAGLFALAESSSLSSSADSYSSYLAGLTKSASSSEPRISQIKISSDTSAYEIVSGWMNKSNRKTKILSEDYKTIGVGVAVGTDGYYYVTVILGTDKTVK